jgi:tRNA threonylcarbamoyladenosine biosynthesis protein TsaB
VDEQFFPNLAKYASLSAIEMRVKHAAIEGSKDRTAPEKASSGLRAMIRRRYREKEPIRFWSPQLQILSLETSGRLGSVALLRSNGGGAQTVVERQTVDGQRTAQSLVPAIQDALKEAAWRPADVELICVTTGPGSFTGLRIGVVTAKALAYATGARLVGVHTLAAMAAGIEPRPARLWTVLDAQRQELFVCRIESGEDLAAVASPKTEILSMPEWLSRLKPGDAVAGPPLQKIRGQVPRDVTLVDPSLWHPQAAAIGRLGWQLFERGGAIDPLELVPHYYRKSAAEEKAAKIAPGH